MTDLELAMKLAELRARAAARCGLKKYAGELIRVAEMIERRCQGGAVDLPTRMYERHAELAAELEYVEDR